MRTSRQPVSEQRRVLRRDLFLQLLVLASLVFSLVLRITDGDRTPWGVAVLVLVLAVLCSIALGVYRLRQLGSSSDVGHVDRQAD